MTKFENLNKIPYDFGLWRPLFQNLSNPFDILCATAQVASKMWKLLVIHLAGTWFMIFNTFLTGLNTK